LLIGLILVSQDEAVTRDAVLSAVGLNLIASVIFAVIFSVLSNRVQERSLDESIEQGFAEAYSRLSGEIARTNSTFLPVAVYDPLNPTGDFGDPFNRDVTRSLEASGFFAFQGPSARFVATRLLKSRRYPQQVKIAMLSPGNQLAISRHASDRIFWPGSGGKTAQDIARALRNELVVNVVSLFDCRNICPIDLLYYEDTAVYRYVMLDDAVYLSWYHSKRSVAMEMPESFQFASESFLYQSLRMDVMRRFEISQSKVHFEASQEDDFLIEHLSNVINERITSSDLAQWRNSYLEQSKSFAEYLEKAYTARWGMRGG
jgi:hypothetical protein